MKRPVYPSPMEIYDDSVTPLRLRLFECNQYFRYHELTYDTSPRADWKTATVGPIMIRNECTRQINRFSVWNDGTLCGRYAGFEAQSVAFETAFFYFRLWEDVKRRKNEKAAQAA